VGIPVPTLAPEHVSDQTDLVLLSENGMLGTRPYPAHAEVDPDTLPLTGSRVVHRVITDLSVLDVTPHGLVPVELTDGLTVNEVRAFTRADVRTP
jgi:acyl CoA:acetate/3-ketoacid CoA transferase beta subunit